MGNLTYMDEDISSGFERLGAIRLQVTSADRIIVGVLEESPTHVALALGRDDEYYLLECPPPKARQIAASLLNKADSIEGVR